MTGDQRTRVVQYEERQVGPAHPFSALDHDDDGFWEVDGDLGTYTIMKAYPLALHYSIRADVRMALTADANIPATYAIEAGVTSVFKPRGSAQ